MSDRKFKAHCRIIDYIDSVDSELSEILRGTCTDMVLGSIRGKPGITFLMPQDKAFRKKIADLAYSDKVEDVNKASDMLNALIFRDVFKSPSDWMAKKDDIPNSLLPSQHVEIDSASGKEIVFKSGAKATLDTDFKDSSRKSNLAVWKLTSGEIPVTSDKPAKLKYAKVARGSKTGGYDAGSIETQTERFKIALAVENAYALHELQRKSGQSLNNSRRDIYLEYTLSLLNYIMHVRKDMSLMYEKVLPVISFDKLDFYILVEPHKHSGGHLLDDMLIHEWWMQKGSHSYSAKAIMKEVESMLNNGSGAMIYTSRPAILEKMGEIRHQISRYSDSRPRGIVEEIVKVYSTLEQSNSLPGLQGPIYPEALAAYYASEPGLKMLHDELRYLTYGSFKRLESDRVFDIGQYHEIVNMIGECLHAGSATERAGIQKLLNRDTIKYIGPVEKIQEILIFVHSTMFLYVPMTESEAMNLKQKHSTSRPNPSNIMIFNIAKDLYTQHKRLLMASPGESSKSIMDALKSLNIETLDPLLKEELKRKLNM